MVEQLSEEMVASYTVQIDGIDRTRGELAKLDGAISRLRSTEYSPFIPTATAAAQTRTGKSDIFVSRMDDLEGRVQTGVRDAMSESMAMGRRVQSEALRAAVTPTGLSGKPKGRKGPGREVTGHMIAAIRTNVETYRGKDFTVVTGWHGWAAGAAREPHYEYQERGTKGRGGASKDSAKTSKSLYRAANTPGRRIPGTRGSVGHPGVPAANSLGQSIVTVREHLKSELRGLKR